MSKEDIIKHAIPCFAQKGYDGTSIAEIIKNAHATKGQLYHHFASKEDLFIQVVFNSHQNKSFETFLQLAKTTSKTVYKKQLLTFGLELIKTYNKNPELAQLSIETLRVLSRNKKLATQLNKRGEESKSYMIQSIQHGKDIGVYNQQLELEYIIFRIKSTLDTIILHNAMKTCMFNYEKMWRKTVEELSL